MKPCCKLTAGSFSCYLPHFFQQLIVSSLQKQHWHPFKRRQDAFLEDIVLKVTEFGTEVQSLPTSAMRSAASQDITRGDLVAAKIQSSSDKHSKPRTSKQQTRAGTDRNGIVPSKSNLLLVNTELHPYSAPFAFYLLASRGWVSRNKHLN